VQREWLEAQLILDASINNKARYLNGLLLILIRDYDRELFPIPRVESLHGTL
jgi:hypothetical protein